ncbi:unnamed protein product [Echinostoma caproni]|uniref:2-methoxy-6-polyprenyl-1,4-benzoquinol methylase, mitochondrial n=1 Tax=Echinostoma caproni TaxID=27848 RepID=A0A183AS31_9TREM|nr:unnamed protein product [Echinostoma caproni]
MSAIIARRLGSIARSSRVSSSCMRLLRRSATTHFGFQTVDEEDKQKKVNHVFENVAEKYDLMNDAMSFGIHRLWKDCFVRQIMPTDNLNCLDQILPTRTREIKSRKTCYSSPCYALVSWVEGNAEELPFEDNTFDLYTIAFGIRNCTHIDKVLAEANRVLRPYGRFFCLEFSHVTNPLLNMAYDVYSMQVIPVMGQLIAGDWDSYQYLVESIRRFPNQDEFADMIRSAGFSSVNVQNYSGGIAAVHSGFKHPRNTKP